MDYLMVVSIHSRDKYERGSSAPTVAPKKTILATIHPHMFLCAGRRNVDKSKVNNVIGPRMPVQPSVRVSAGYHRYRSASYQY